MSGGPCAACGEPGEWVHGLSWLCDGCSREAGLAEYDVHEETRRASAEEIADEERAERFAAWSEGP